MSSKSKKSRKSSHVSSSESGGDSVETKTINKKEDKKDTKKSTHATDGTEGTKGSSGNLKMDSTDPDKVILTEFKPAGTQKLAFMNYNDGATNSRRALEFQTSKINVKFNLITMLDSERKEKGYTVKGHYPDDTKRRFVRIYFVPGQPALESLKSLLQRFDEYYGSKTFSEKTWGKKSGSYNYAPLVKPPYGDDEDEDDKKKKSKKNKKKGSGEDEEEKPRYDNVKIPFSIDFESKKITTIFQKIENGKKKTLKNVDVTQLLENGLGYGSDIKVVFGMSKLYVQPIDGVKGMFKYAIGLKLKILRFTQCEKGSGYKSKFDSDSDGFDGESIDEESGESGKRSKSDKSKKSTKTEKKSKLDSDSDEDSKPSKKSSGKDKKAKKAASSSSEKSDDGDISSDSDLKSKKTAHVSSEEEKDSKSSKKKGNKNSDESSEDNKKKKDNKKKAASSDSGSASASASASSEEEKKNKNKKGKKGKSSNKDN